MEPEAKRLSAQERSRYSTAMRTEDTPNPDAVPELGSGLPPLAPPDLLDPVIEAYKKDVDRTLFRENLKLSYLERLRKLERTAAAMLKWRGAARRRLTPKTGAER